MRLVLRQIVIDDDRLGRITSYVLISAAALARLTGSLLITELYSTAMLVSALLWTTALTIFSCVYAPVLTRPRVGDRAG